MLVSPYQIFHIWQIWNICKADSPLFKQAYLLLTQIKLPVPESGVALLSNLLPVPLGTSIVALVKKKFMKGKYFVAAGLAIIGAGIYFFLKRKKAEQQRNVPEKENERHHLTNVFSKAKKVAVGN